MTDSPYQSIEATLYSGATDGAAFRLDLIQRNDRIGQRISWRENGQDVVIAESVEGDETQQWPVSPCFQDLRIERIEDRNVALLTGMSGRSHWSLSVEPAVTGIGLIFDAAVRVQSVPPSITSVYQLPATGQSLPRSDCEGVKLITLNADHRRYAWTADYEGTELLVGTDPRANGSLLTIQPAQLSVSIPSTVRWKYGLNITCRSIDSD